jgi:hypothetical protein
MTHIRKKVFKAILPMFANIDSSASVVFIRRIIGIIATLAKMIPASILWGIIRVPMSFSSLAEFFALKTTARFTVSSSKGSDIDGADSATIALQFPLSSLTSNRGQSFDGNQSSKSLSGNVLKWSPSRAICFLVHRISLSRLAPNYKGEMIMNKLLKAVISAVAILLSMIPAFAQTGQVTLTGTTLAAAATVNTNIIRVASATGITTTAGTTATGLYIDNEYLVVTAVNGTTLTVSRGQAGTRANSHLSGAAVLAGPPRAFYNTDPSGSCTPANVAYTPYVNIVTGNQWLCSTVLTRWVPGFGNPGNSGTPAGVTTAVASVAGATAVSGPLFHITGTNAITSFTLPVGFKTGFCVIPDAAFTTVAGNNIAEASTADANQTLCFTYDLDAGLLYSSY